MVMGSYHAAQMRPPTSEEYGDQGHSSDPAPGGMPSALPPHCPPDGTASTPQPGRKYSKTFSFFSFQGFFKVTGNICRRYTSTYPHTIRKISQVRSPPPRLYSSLHASYGVLAQNLIGPESLGHSVFPRSLCNFLGILIAFLKPSGCLLLLLSALRDLCTFIAELG